MPLSVRLTSNVTSASCRSLNQPVWSIYTIHGHTFILWELRSFKVLVKCVWPSNRCSWCLHKASWTQCEAVLRTSFKVLENHQTAEDSNAQWHWSNCCSHRFEWQVPDFFRTGKKFHAEIKPTLNQTKTQTPDCFHPVPICFWYEYLSDLFLRKYSFDFFDSEHSILFPGQDRLSLFLSIFSRPEQVLQKFKIWKQLELAHALLKAGQGIFTVYWLSSPADLSMSVSVSPSCAQHAIRSFLQRKIARSAKLHETLINALRFTYTCILSKNLKVAYYQMS